MLGALLSTAYLAVFLLAVHKLPFFRGPALSKPFLMAMLVLKVMAGTGLWWLYTYHYTSRADADIYKFFDASAPMYNALWTNPGDYFRMLFGIANDSPYFDKTYYVHIDHWYRQYESNLFNDAHTMIRFNAFVRIFSFGYYHVHTVFICFLSLIGLVCLHKAFAPALPGKERALAISVFLLPSVLFWGSGVVKESLLLFALGVFLLNALEQLRNGWSGYRVLAIVGSTTLLLVLKYYVLACLLPGLLALIVCLRWKSLPTMWTFAAVTLLCLIAAANIHYVLPGFDLAYLLSVKQKDMYGLATATGAGSLVYVPRLTEQVWSFLTAAPVALFNALLGPSVLLKGGALAIPSALENTVLIAALLLGWFYRDRNDQRNRALIYCCLGYCLLMLLIIGWTTPVMGALVRYRMPMLPFLAIIALLLVDAERLVARWPRMKSFVSGV